MLTAEGAASFLLEGAYTLSVFTITKAIISHAIKYAILMEYGQVIFL